MVSQSFIEQLRSLGFSISITEQIDAARVTKYSTNLKELKIGVRGIFCKSLAEQKIFDVLFDIHTANEDQNSNNTVSKNFQLKLKETIFELNLDRPHVRDQIDPIRMGLGLLVEQQLRGVQCNYKLAIKKLFFEGEQSAAHHILLRYLIPGSNTFAEVLEKRDRVMNEIEESMKQAFPNIAETAMNALNSALYQEIKGTMRSSEELGLNSSVSTLNIEDRPILELDNSLELQKALRIFARSIASKKKKRRKSNRKLDLRRTIRKNIQRGGVLIEQVKRERKKSKPRLLVMTDVSPSTMHATKLFLSIIQMVRDLFSDIHYYEFIGSLVDVTTEIQKARSIPDSIDKVISKWDEVKNGKESSDYQQALKSFSEIAKNYLNRNYTVIILGDCRDWLGGWKEGKPMSAKYIGEIQSKTRGIFIFNPEPKHLWDKGDSVVTHYRIQGAKILETITLKQLAENISGIF